MRNISLYKVQKPLTKEIIETLIDNAKGQLETYQKDELVEKYLKDGLKLQ